jgi:uncharacterized protein (TIGR02001 family)
MRKVLLATASVAAIMASPVFAQTAPAAPASLHTVTGNLAITSQYIYRGLTQTNGKPAVQGGFDYAHASGFYAGTWLSNISWFTDQNANIKSAPVSLGSPGSVGAPYAPNRSNAASLEWDFYGGYKNSFAGGDWNYDIGAIQYYYPGKYDNLGAYRKPNTTELYGAVGYKWLTLKYSKGVSTNTFGVNEGKGADYLDLTAAVPIGETGFTVLAHVGKQNYPGKANVGYWGASGGNNNYFDYTDYKLGVSKEYLGFTFSAAWSRANTKDAAPDGETTAYMNAFGKNIGGNRFAVSMSKTF